MASDFGTVVAAITAGFKQTTLDRGASAPAATRWEVTLEKPRVGYPGQSGALERAYGQGSSQANAEAQALAALNAQRTHRYGKGSANTGKSIHGDSITDDLH